MQNKSDKNRTDLKRKNTFEKHPKIALIAILFVVFIAAIIFVEQILGYQNRSKTNSHYDNYGIKRYIVISEGRPLSSGYQIPSNNILQTSDNLERQKYIANYDINGFMEPSEIHEIPDYKIFFLGGSTTECFYNNVEKRFPYLSGRLLEKMTELNVNSYNSARSGNNSVHSINILYNKLLALNPNVILLMHNCNDIVTISMQGSYWNNTGRYRQIENHKQISPLHSIVFGIRDLLIPNISSSIANLFQAKTEIKKTISPGKQAVVDYANYTDLFERNLNIFISMCKCAGTTPVLVTQANRLIQSPDKTVLEYHKHLHENCGVPLTYQQFRKLHKLFNETIRMLGEENNILVVDLDRLIPKNKDYIFDAYHLTDKGSVLASEIFAKALKKIVQQNEELISKDIKPAKFLFVAKTP